MSEIIHALIFLINVLLPSLDLMLVYHKSTLHTTLQAPVLKFSLRSASSPLFSLQSPSSARIKNRNCFARALADVSKRTKRKIEQCLCQANLHLNVFLPKKPTFANSRGAWGEGRNEENRKEIDIFPLSIHPPRSYVWIFYRLLCLLWRTSFSYRPFTQLQGRDMDKNLKKSAICLIVCDSIPLGPVPERPIQR